MAIHYAKEKGIKSLKNGEGEAQETKGEIGTLEKLAPKQSKKLMYMRNMKETKRLKTTVILACNICKE